MEQRKEYREMTGRRNPKPNRSVDQGPITSKDLFSMLVEAPQLKSPVLSSDNFFCFSTEEMPVVDDVGGADEERGSAVVEPNPDPPPVVGNAAQEDSPNTANEVKEEIKEDVKEEVKDEVKSEPS